MKKAAIIGIIFVIAVIAAIYFSTGNLAAHRVEICMEFKGLSSCATASGATEEVARRSAITTACATISSGVTDSIACDQTAPKKVTWLK